nr:type 1 glutamine amidotransferase [Mesorhizobium sp. SP-1A]
MNILVFQHLRVEHSGIFGEFWREAGHREHIVELDEGDAVPPLDGFDMLAVMGGPMDVWQEEIHSWLAPEKAAIRRWVRELGRPYLGICLGHQLLADALGGKVGLMRQSEVGLADVELTMEGRNDRLFAGVEPKIRTLQWHGAEVQSLPEGAEILASNQACAVQAMRVGPNAYGFQYHMEITERTVDDWARIPEYKASLERAMGSEEAEKLAAAVAPNLAEFRNTARRINDNFFSAPA